MELIHLLETSAARFPERIAVTHGETSITFADLWMRVGHLSDYLSRCGFQTGDRAALMFENSIDYTVAFFAITRAGLVVVPLDTSAHPETINNILQDSGARLLICQSRYQRHLPRMIEEIDKLTWLISEKPLRVELSIENRTDFGQIAETTAPMLPKPEAHQLSWDTSPDDLAAIFYTSGSTGAAKGVMLSHRNLVSNTVGTVEYLQLTERDSVIVILPFYYIYGNSLLLTHIACGGRLVVDNRFLYPEVILDTMEQQKVTGFSGVPSNFIILLNKSTFGTRKLADLRYFTQAGGAMAPEIIQQVIDVHGDKEIFIMYGQTEAAPRASWLPPDRLREKLGSIGIAVPGVRLELVDDHGQPVTSGATGEIAVSGPNVMLGYWNQPDDTAEVIRDGKLLTGDLARIDDDGFFYVVGRKKEIIKTGGNRVSAKEVEECLLSHPKVMEAAVVGIPDDLLGEGIQAAVALQTGESCEQRELQEHCQQHLAPHKSPQQVHFYSSLPKYQSGKINKPLLVKTFREQQSSTPAE